MPGTAHPWCSALAPPACGEAEIPPRAAESCCGNSPPSLCLLSASMVKAFAGIAAAVPLEKRFICIIVIPCRSSTREGRGSDEPPVSPASDPRLSKPIHPNSTSRFSMKLGHVFTRQPRTRPAKAVPGQPQHDSLHVSQSGQEDTDLYGIWIPRMAIPAKNSVLFRQPAQLKHKAPAVEACCCRRSTSRVSVSSAWCC